MKSALVGYTGFVGSNLADSHRFSSSFNTSNIDEIAGQEFDLVVSAGNRADSFRINQNQEADLAEVDGLIARLKSTQTKKLVLISTVCVYPQGGAPDEGTPLSTEGLTPYGQNRLHQERVLSENFDTLIVRLPQLVGNRLKKGVVFDLAHDYRVEYIRPEASFQHYDVRNLWRDIQVALDAGIPSLNIATPAITNAELAREVFGRDISGQQPAGEESPFSQMYTRNMQTTHSDLYSAEGRFLRTREQSLAELRDFVAELQLASASEQHQQNGN